MKTNNLKLIFKTISINLLFFLVFPLLAIACDLQGLEQTPDSGGDNNHHSFAAELLELHNNARAMGLTCKNTKITAPALIWNNNLAQAAQRQSEKMHQMQTLSHQLSEGETTQDRIQSSGPWQAYSENIASGASTAADVVTLWTSSPAHCTNMINPIYTDMGGAQVNGYWTAIYATRRLNKPLP